MAIESPRMGSGNTKYPNKRKLNPGNPPKLIQKAKDGGVTRSETPAEKYARYVATYGKAGADQKLQQELQEAERKNLFAPSPVPSKRYEPSQGVKNTKAGLAAFSLGTSAIPPISYLGNVAGSVYDFGTAARYALDGNWEMAAEDALQGTVGLIPNFLGGIGAKGEQLLTQGQRFANNLLQSTQKVNDAAQINEAFKWGGSVKRKLKKMQNGGVPDFTEDPTTPPKAPKGYKPLTIQQRQDWNSFVQYLNRDLKIGGDKSLDDRTKDTGLNYLRQYAKDHPGFSITPELVPSVQYEFQELNTNRSLPGQRTSGRVKEVLDQQFKGRTVSDVDGWIGSLTSRQGYPIVLPFTEDKEQRYWNLDYTAASDYEDQLQEAARKKKELESQPGYRPKVPSASQTVFKQGGRVGGGLDRSEDYGSSKKPYPSVDKSDFAGGGRSYPIPTKADAVDALRLAGLHGRSDVKAKVYAKYPELKKGKYGLKMMADGGLPDTYDPLFAQKLQEFLQNNPDALDPFSPTTSSTPPGVTGQEITLPDQSVTNNIEATNTLDTNTNSQQNRRRGPKVQLPSINFGDAVAGLAQGANALATEFISNPRTRANEMRLLRRQLAPVVGKPSFGGFDMPVLAKSGIQITSAYTDNIGRPITTKRNPWGNTADQFKVDDPNFANVQTEGGEFLELPDGTTSTINGDKHSDYSGGELMNLPEGAKVYSDSIKVDKQFQKDLTGSSGKKKKTVAQIAKKYSTDHEEGILKDPTSDNLSKRSANIMRTFKQGQLQQLFDYQESVKDPLYMLNKDASAQDYIGSEDTVVARDGIKVMQDGGQPPRRRRSKGVPYAPSPMNRYYIDNGLLSSTTVPVQETPAQVVPGRNPLWWQNIGTPVQGTPPPINLQGQIAMLERPNSTLTTPDSTPPSDLVPPTSTPWTRLNLRVPDLENPDTVTPPELQPSVPPTTVQPGTTIDSSKPRKPIPDNNKQNPPAPQPKIPWGNSLNAIGEIVPELTAFIQNQTDFPIFTAKYQPRYLNPVELNIQSELNRNFAQTQPLLQSTGNPAQDNARAAQAVANLYDANNQAFMQKFNFDTQNRYQTDATNLQIENEANRYNLQRADDFWNKVTARQAVKEATNNNIANSAYAKFKRKQFEQRSLQLTNQLADNFKYDPQRGVYFTPNGEEYIFHAPSGSLVNIGGAAPGDGVETTKTIRNTPRGTTTTLRQKEKRGS